MSETPADDDTASDPAPEPAKVEAPETDSVENGEPLEDGPVHRGDVEMPRNEQYDFSEPIDDVQTFGSEED